MVELINCVARRRSTRTIGTFIMVLMMTVSGGAAMSLGTTEAEQQQQSGDGTSFGPYDSSREPFQPNVPSRAEESSSESSHSQTGNPPRRSRFTNDQIDKGDKTTVPAQEKRAIVNAEGKSPTQAGSITNRDSTAPILVAIFLLAVCVIASFFFSRKRLNEVEFNLGKKIDPLSKEATKNFGEFKTSVETATRKITDATTDFAKAIADIKYIASKFNLDSQRSLHPRREERYPEADLQHEKEEFHREKKKLEEDRARLEEEKASLKVETLQLKTKQKEVTDRETNVGDRENNAKLRENELKSREANCDRIKEQSESALKSAEEARNTAIAERNESERIEQRLRLWREEFWPKSFHVEGPLSKWRVLLEKHSLEGKTAATLVCLALAKCRALIASGDKDLELPKALHEVSRYLYVIWSEMEEHPGQLAEFAREWKTAIDAELVGRYTIRLAEVGVPKDQSWMTYADGNTPVQKVHSWCVQNDRKVAVQRANVT